MAPADAPVVLLGGNVNALSAARSLGGRGVPVYALAESDEPRPVGASRYVRRFVPAGTSWDDWLAAAPAGAVVLPCSDRGLEYVATRRAALVGLGHHPVEADDGLVLALLDKAATYEVARRAGIDAPRVWRVDSEDALAAAVAELDFPCAVKPLHPHRAPPSFRAKGVVVATPDGLVALARSVEGVVATEIVPGPDDAFCSYYTYLVEGEPLFSFTKRKLRQFPIRWGTGTLHCTEWVPDAADAGLRLFRAAGLVGLGNVEFKRDARDGRLKLIECNLRLTEADPMIRAAGLDLAHLLYERALGRHVAAPARFAEGMRQWHPMADVRAFLAYRREGDLTAGQWARSLLRPTRLPLFAADDVRPSVANLRILAGRAGRAARRAAAGPVR